MELSEKILAMPDDQSVSARTGKELLKATRPFAAEIRARSWWCVGTTFLALAGAVVVASAAPWWPLRAFAAVIGGLVFVRAFILFHDFLHGSLLRRSRLAKGLFFLFGLLVLTPSRNWRRSHNFHHANVGKPLKPVLGEFMLVTSDVGGFALMTTEVWQRATFWQRLKYRISRSPLTILFAYLTVFFGNLCLVPLLKNPRKHWESLLAVLVHGGAIVGLWILGGFWLVFFAFLLPFAIAAMAGAYLFFAQHNFEGMHLVPLEQWTYYRGALESSSYMKLGPILRWFTGNIGYHHVHHLNPLIPFYRLPEAMAAIPELQHPMITSLYPADVFACFRLNLWDQQQQCLVSYHAARAQAAKSRK